MDVDVVSGCKFHAYVGIGFCQSAVFHTGRRRSATDWDVGVIPHRLTPLWRELTKDLLCTSDSE